MNYVISNKKSINGTINVAPDKSISHRGVMFGSIAMGTTTIENFLMGDDCLATIEAFRNLGIQIQIDKNKILVHGKGLHGLKPSKRIIDVGNSGTTIRLLTGLFSGQDFITKITGDSSIQKRPMDRIINPLLEMGADIHGDNNTTLAPLKIVGSKLYGFKYKQKVASAQVKSAILLAGLYASTPMTVIEPIKSRNHTEIMLKHFGADIKISGDEVTVTPVKELYASDIFVPNDISSAAFFIVAGLILENSRIKLLNVGINPTRTGIIDALIEMGGNISISNIRDNSGELMADIIVKSSNLHGITIGGDIIPRMIDEIPVFAVAGLFASGETIVKDAEELKVKETNRIDAVVNEFKRLGGKIKGTSDGMIIQGDNHLNGGVVESYHDHRMAMSLAILGLMIEDDVTINDFECVDISFPDFLELLNNNTSN